MGRIRHILKGTWASRAQLLAVFAFAGAMALNIQPAPASGSSQAPVGLAGDSENGVGAKKLVVLVDGKEHPEQVPDDLALMHFLLSVAAHEKPSAEEIERQTHQLALVGLRSLDQLQLISMLGQMTTKLDAIEAARQVSEETADDLLRFRTERDAVISRTIIDLRSALTPEGRSRLERHIAERVKRNIKIYGTPN